MSRDGSRATTGPSDAARDAARRIEAELREFECNERGRLGIADEPQWREARTPIFTEDEKSRTTLFFGSLTATHDALLEAGLKSHGYNAKALPCPDNESLQIGKEFGNRGQCNPTYFTVGNLLRELIRLRDVEGLAVADIVANHAFVTFSACGPCRFGTYATEYRKALRDAGFAGFRVIPLRQEAPDRAGDAAQSGLRPSLGLYLTFIRCV
ncbi:MAG TPA: 2-hydroxyglutaryl-CoA dehydratase, partial [Alphaproteobacteria bacterium]|nr:2-hydroxyglutaryl-CoA dehydratase [Alphaproteobacteria bacterium]